MMGCVYKKKKNLLNSVKTIYNINIIYIMV